MSEAEPRPYEYQPHALIIVPGIEWDEWSDLWSGIEQTHKSMSFWIGDALLAGQREFGERFSQVVDPKYIYQQAGPMWVCRSFPPARRRPACSYSMHKELAALEPEDQDKWLDQAEANAWTVRELKAAMRDAVRKGNGGPPLNDPGPPGDEPPPLEPEQNSTWNKLDDGDTFGDPTDIDGSTPPEPPQNGYGNGASDTTYPPNGISALAQGDRADDIRALIAAVRRLAPDLSDAWRMETFRIEGRESTVKLVRGDQLAVGIGPSLPCALIEAALSALLSDLGAG